MTKEENLATPRKYTEKSEKQIYTIQNAIKEFEELKNIALNCLDKNGNPNISAAMRAVENKAKIAGLYQNKAKDNTMLVQMSEIKINGEQLKLNIGEDLY